MAWWIARFECGEELEVSTATQDKQVAWEKVKGMFPNKELVDLMTEDDEGVVRSYRLRSGEAGVSWSIPAA